MEEAVTGCRNCSITSPLLPSGSVVDHCAAAAAAAGGTRIAPSAGLSDAIVSLSHPPGYRS